MIIKIIRFLIDEKSFAFELFSNYDMNKNKDGICYDLIEILI